MVKIQTKVSEEKFFEGKVYGRTHAQKDRWTQDSHNAMTIAHWPLASGAKTRSTPMQMIRCYSLPSENTVGKWLKKCCKPAFSPFPTMPSTLPKRSCNFLATYTLSSANTLNSDQLKILSSGKDLILILLIWNVEDYTAMDGFLVTENDSRAAKRAVQNQTACICRLILLYTLLKISS